MYNILICDDDRDIVSALDIYLTSEGYKTYHAYDGLEALKAIRAKDGNANIVMCTAMGQEAMVVEAVQAGTKDFIVKPFKEDRLLKTVTSIIGAP